MSQITSEIIRVCTLSGQNQFFAERGKVKVQRKPKINCLSFSNDSARIIFKYTFIIEAVHLFSKHHQVEGSEQQTNRHYESSRDSKSETCFALQRYVN